MDGQWTPRPSRRACGVLRGRKTGTESAVPAPSPASTCDKLHRQFELHAEVCAHLEHFVALVLDELEVAGAHGRVGPSALAWTPGEVLHEEGPHLFADARDVASCLGAGALQQQALVADT